MRALFENKSRGNISERTWGSSLLLSPHALAGTGHGTPVKGTLVSDLNEQRSTLSDLLWSGPGFFFLLFIFAQKAFYVHNSRNVAAKFLKHTRNVSLLFERRIPRTGYHCTIMAAGVRAIFGPCRQVAGLVPKNRDGMTPRAGPSRRARFMLRRRAHMHMEWE